MFVFSNGSQIWYTNHGLQIKYNCTVISLPPDTKTLSELTARQLIIVLCPCRLCKKLPSGNFHILILSGDALANVKLKKKDNNHIFFNIEDKAISVRKGMHTSSPFNTIIQELW